MTNAEFNNVDFRLFLSPKKVQHIQKIPPDILYSEGFFMSYLHYHTISSHTRFENSTGFSTGIPSIRSA